MIKKLQIIFILSLTILIKVIPTELIAQTENKIQPVPATHSRHLPKLIPYRQGELWGFSDSTGTIKVQPKYRLVSLFEQGFARVYVTNGAGIIDDNGNELVKPDYSSVQILKNGLILAENREGKSGILNRKGEEVIPLVYDFVSFLYTPEQQETIVMVSIEQKLHPAQQTNRRERTRSLKGLYSISGERILPVEFTEINNKGEGIFEACKGDKCQYITLTGQVIFPLKLHRLSTFHEGITSLCEEDGCQYVNTQGDVVIKKKYRAAFPFSEGLAAVVGKDNKWGYIDKKGNFAIPAQYETGRPFENGVALVRKDNKTGVIDREGNLVVDFQAAEVRLTPADEPGKFWLRTGSKTEYGQIDSKTKKFVAIEAPKQNAGKLSDGLAMTYSNGKYGFVDAEGKVVIPTEYNQVTPFINGIAAVSKDGFWGVIDKQNKMILPFMFREIQILSPDIFKVRISYASGTNAMWGLINREGLEVAQAKYSSIGEFINGVAPFALNNTYGMLNLKGEEVIKPIPIPAGYNACEPLKNGLIKVCSATGRKEGYVDYRGKPYFQD